MNNAKRNLKVAIIMALSLFLIIGCEKQLKDETSFPEVTTESEPVLKEGDYCIVDLLAGQTIEVGTVTTEFVSSYIVLITYTITDPEWCIMETHLDVQSDPDNFPQTSSGNPKVGHFAYGEELECALSWSQTIDLNTVTDWEEGMTLYIAAHAEVINQLQEDESAWGDGVSFRGNNWAMYFECVPPPSWECGEDPLIDERDGKSYNTVQIGDQCWMAENLNIGVFKESINTGSYHSDVLDNGIIEKYCYGNDINNCDKYGGLYDWDEMMNYTAQEGTRGICPEGWYLPTDTEWKVLEGTVDSQYPVGDHEWNGILYRGFDAGYNLKSTSEWYNNGNGNDTFGFSARPGGYRNIYGGFESITLHSHNWSSSDYNSMRAWYRYPYYDNNEVGRTTDGKAYGFSVRCLKDE